MFRTAHHATLGAILVIVATTCPATRGSAGGRLILKDNFNSLRISSDEGLAITAAVEALRRKNVDVSKYEAIYVDKGRERFRVLFSPPFARSYPPRYAVHVLERSLDVVAIQICSDICLFEQNRP